MEELKKGAHIGQEEPFKAVRSAAQVSGTFENEYSNKTYDNSNQANACQEDIVKATLLFKALNIL